MLCTYQRIMAQLPVETQFKIFLGATEVQEFGLLSGNAPPTEAQLRARAQASPAWHDSSFLGYDLVLFHTNGLRPGGYNGSATAQKSTGPGGGSSRSSSDLVSIGKSMKTRMYDFVRSNAGQLGFCLHFRIDVSELDSRYAVLQAARCVTQYIAEVCGASCCLHI